MSIQFSVERFWSKVDRSGGPDACWPWTAGLTEVRKWKQRYGQVWYRGAVRRAHRVAWQITNGDIPSGINVCHRCDNGICCNPAHLFLGTTMDNVLDRERKGRGNQPKGVNNAFAKLTDADVMEARRLWAEGVPARALARRYAITQKTMVEALSGVTWKHVPQESR